MINLKKYLGVILIIILFTGIFFGYQKISKAQTKEVNLYFFWGNGCPHCAAEKPFLETLKQKYPQLHVYDFEVWYNSKNRDLLIKVGKQLNIDISGVPLTIINNQPIIGYYNDETTGKQIENLVIQCLNNICNDSIKDIVFKNSTITTNKEITSTSKPEEFNTENSLPITPINKLGEFNSEKPLPEKLKIPLIGDIETKNLSLPALAILIGGLDGFNPCAMWVLVFLITLLLKMQDRKRMWILGITFITASAGVYFLFMTAWLNLILFLGFIFWIRLLVGLVALGSGIYNLRDYFKNPEAACEVTNPDQKKTTIERMKDIVHRKSFLLALIGIIILAASVNLIELICSAGFPVIFTQLLALSHLAKWQYYLYMLLYLFVFMLDDIIVFVGAMFTLRVTGITNKYSHLSKLIGGILMLLIGILLIFKPELLMFG